MKKIVMLMIIGLLLLVGCSIPQEVQDELEKLEQLRIEKEQWVKWEPELKQLRQEKENWEKIEKPDLEQQISDLETQLAEQVKPLKDPTHDELLTFLVVDQTDELWPPPLGGHLEMTFQLLKNAAEKGIRGFPVIVLAKSKQYWYFTGFRTTDRGLVYILSSRDRAVRLEEGKDYRKINNLSPSKIDSTIVKIWVFDFN